MRHRNHYVANGLVFLSSCFLLNMRQKWIFSLLKSFRSTFDWLSRLSVTVLTAYSYLKFSCTRIFISIYLPHVHKEFGTLFNKLLMFCECVCSCLHAAESKLLIWEDTSNYRLVNDTHKINNYFLFCWYKCQHLFMYVYIRCIKNSLKLLSKSRSDLRYESFEYYRLFKYLCMT